MFVSILFFAYLFLSLIFILSYVYFLSQSNYFMFLAVVGWLCSLTLFEESNYLKHFYSFEKRVTCFFIDVVRHKLVRLNLGANQAVMLHGLEIGGFRVMPCKLLYLIHFLQWPTQLLLRYITMLVTFQIIICIQFSFFKLCLQKRSKIEIGIYTVIVTTL